MNEPELVGFEPKSGAACEESTKLFLRILPTFPFWVNIGPWICSLGAFYE